MNDSSTPNSSRPCESRAEDISLLAADCLTTLEADDLRCHFATCTACRQRFEQLQSVCSGLRAAKPTVEVSRWNMNDVGRDVPPATRRRRAMLAVVVAGVLVLLSALLNVSRRPEVDAPHQDIELAHESPTSMDSDSKLVPLLQPQQPTWLALRQAAAVSDEALDRLMAQASVPMFSEPFNAQPLWQEPLP